MPPNATVPPHSRLRGYRCTLVPRVTLPAPGVGTRRGRTDPWGWGAGNHALPRGFWGPAQRDDVVGLSFGMLSPPLCCSSLSLSVLYV